VGVSKSRSAAPSRSTTAATSRQRSRPQPDYHVDEESTSGSAIDDKYDKTGQQQNGFSGDWGAIGLLMLLYTLQGIPMGLSGSIPFLMQAKGVSMGEQAQFSTVSWPFSLKLLWAPLVDAVYVPSFGRRKTWIVPMQLAIGVLLLLSGPRIDAWLGAGDGSPDVDTLTRLFFGFYFLAATQDIAVDGLALTVLSERNKELGATCNAIGQSVGYFLAYTVFLAFNTPEFCNKYFRGASAQSQDGIFSLGGFMSFWGGIFLISTACVIGVRRDEHHREQGSIWQQLAAAYHEMFRVIQLPAVRSTALLLLTNRVAFATVDSVLPLRLVEWGVPKEHLALLASVVMPVGMASQAFVSVRYFSGASSQPMSVWLAAYPCRLATGVFSLAVGGIVAGHVGPLSTWIYAAMLVATIAATLSSSVMFVAQMAFFNRVSDPAIGGTYMTMLNTLANMGAAWTTPVALASVGLTTVERCVPTSADCNDPPAGAVWLRFVKQLIGQRAKSTACPCEQVTELDGFVFVAVASSMVGIVWFALMRPHVTKLQALPADAWLASQ